MNAIEVNNVSKSYGAVKALDEVSFSVGQGEVFGLIGPDGAGKTSMYRILCTLLLPDSGTVTVDGFDAVRQMTDIRRRVGYMPGKFSLYEDLTVQENLEFFATLFGTTVDEGYDSIKAIYSQIERFKDRRAGALSGGEQPQIVPSRGGWYVMDGENGTNKVECGNAVQFAGSSLYWRNATLLERKAFTIEFFAKFRNLANGVNLVRCVKSDAAGGSLVWCLWKADNVKLQFSAVPVKSDGTLDSQRASNILTSGFDGGDGLWHHWAITIDSTDGEHIYAKVYRDYEQLGDTASINGTLDVPPQNGNRLGISLGGTGNAGAYIDGTFDQVRVSAGILDPSEFMRYDSTRGTVLTVR